MDDITNTGGAGIGGEGLGGAGIRITTLAERPELAARLWDMKDSWPEFAQHDSLAWLLYPRMVAEFPEYVLIATDGDTVVARGFGVPFAQHAPGRGGELPAQGWDRILMWAFSDLRRGVEADTVSAIEISVATGRQGEGLSGRMLAAMRENARARGFAEVVAPVRPSGSRPSRTPRSTSTRTAPARTASPTTRGYGSTCGRAASSTRWPRCR